MIKSIQYENFRGQSDKYELKDLQLFTGPNGAGKTTILNAIEFAIKGTIGKVKTNAEIHSKFVSDLICTVILKTTQGDVITRVISEIEKFDKNTGQYKYTYSQSLEIDGHQKISGTIKGQEYIDVVFNIPGVAFNFAEFLDMTSSGRRDFFLGLVSFTEMSHEEITSYLKNVLISDEMDEEYKEILESSIEEMEFETLEKAIEWAEHAYKKYNKQKTVDKNAAIKLNQLKNELQGNIKRISQLEEDVEFLNKDKEENIKQLQHTKSTLKEIESDKNQMLGLENEKETLSNTEHDKLIKETATEIVELDKQLKLLKITDTSDLVAQSESLKEEVLKSTSKFDELDIAKKLIDKEILKINDRIKIMQEDVDAIEDIQCPIIKQACPSSDKLKEMYKKEIILEKENFVPKQNEIYKMIEEMSFLELEIQSSKRRVIEAKNSLSKAADENAKNKKDSEAIAAQTNIKIKELQKLEAEKQTKEAVITRLENQIKTIKEHVYEIYTDEEDLEGIREGIDSNLKELKEELANLNRKQRDIQNQSRTIEDGRQSTLKFNAISIIKTGLGPNGLQGDIIKNNLSEISNELSELIHKFGKEEVFYFNTMTKQGKEDFNFGWIREKEEINFDSLSRGEQMITTAAMLIIFLNRMNSALKLIMLDEINNLDDLNLDNIFKAFSDLEHEQIIIAGVLNTKNINIGKFKEIKI